MATLYEKFGIGCLGILGILMIVGVGITLAETNIVFLIYFLLSVGCIMACILLLIHLIKKYPFIRSFAQNLIRVISILFLLFILNCFVKNWFNSFCYIITFSIGLGLLVNLKNRFSRDIVEIKEYKNFIDVFDFENALKILETAFNNPKNKQLKLDIFITIRDIANYLKQYNKIIQYEQCLQKTEQLNNISKLILLESTFVANIHLKNFQSLEMQKNIIYDLLNNEQDKNKIVIHFELYEIYIMIEQNRFDEALNILKQNFEKYKTVATLPTLHSIYSTIYAKLNDIENAKEHLKKAIASTDNTYTYKMILIDKLSKLV